MSSTLACWIAVIDLKFLRSFCLRLGPNPHAIKFGTETILTTDLSMEGDGKAVYFILNTVKEEKLLGLTWQINDSQKDPQRAIHWFGACHFSEDLQLG